MLVHAGRKPARIRTNNMNAKKFGNMNNTQKLGLVIAPLTSASKNVEIIGIIQKISNDTRKVCCER